MVKSIALDITTDSIRVLQGEIKKNKITIVDGFELNVPKVVNGEIENVEGIIEELLDNLNMKHGKKQNVNLLFPSKTAQNQLIQTPIMEEKILKKSIPSHYQQQFSSKEKHVNSASHCMDYAVYGIAEIEKRQYSLLLSSLGRERALHWMKIFNEHKFRLNVIETPVNNLYYVTEISKKNNESYDLVIQLLNFETNLLFLQKGIPIFHRYLKFGVQNMLQMPDQFFEQIFRTIEKFRQDFKIDIGKVLLIGEVSQWFGIKGSFQEAFVLGGVEIFVRDWNLKAGEQYQSDSLVVVNDTHINYDSSFATTLGLLAREVL